MASKAFFVYNPHEIDYHFHPDHPFNQKRLQLTADLLEKAGALPPSLIKLPRLATIEEIEWVHNADYREAVQALSQSQVNEESVKLAERYGLAEGDTPFFERMHDSTSLVAGGTIEAVELVMSGQSKHALHLAGGLHHAMPHKGAGFCVYNDAAIGIAHARRKYDVRVLYIDTDAHHGDGVQFTFYSDPEVSTLSIHETGKYLFPGTGKVEERGEGNGFGHTINIPVEPYTEDDSWLNCFTTALDRVARSFRPDIIISQHGCDAHAWDPLAHMHCSMRIYLEMPRLIQEAAERWCDGRWVALGGGGYDIWRVVPRAWGLLWLTMSGHQLAAEIKANPQLQLPENWLDLWQPESPVKLPERWLDAAEDIDVMPRRQEIEAKNRHTLENALLYHS